MTNKEKLQKLSAIIGKFELEIKYDNSLSVQQLHIKREALSMAKKEFSRLAKIYQKEKKV